MDTRLEEAEVHLVRKWEWDRGECAARLGGDLAVLVVCLVIVIGIDLEVPLAPLDVDHLDEVHRDELAVRYEDQGEGE